MDYIAHIREKDGKIQTTTEHSIEVKQACEDSGSKIGLRYLAGLSGWLHDMGKNTLSFKSYIEEAAANPDNPPRRGSVDHSTAGGKLLYDRFHRGAKTSLDKLTAECVANCIISHHQGLRDFLDPQSSSPFLDRVANKELPDYEQAKAVFLRSVGDAEFEQYFAEARKELAEVLERIQKHALPPIVFSLVMKYIFSCLIDADRTNTRQFEEDEAPEAPFDSTAFFNRCYDLLMKKIRGFDRDRNASHPINRLRREMSDQCEAFALERPSGIYTLSIPTGGGKTLASLRYAIKHAIATGKERIVYIVPYTTIIEQNAAEIRDILQEHDLILEHHSNVVEEIGEETEDYDVRKKKIRLARDNWDRPIIFTTMVQFLNTFYAKGTRNIRRMHRLVNSVLIFDEVQSVPLKSISLFNAALNFLHFFGRSSVVLCTATQPALDYVKHHLRLSERPEMIGSLDKVAQRFKRVEIEDRTEPEGWGAERLAEFVGERLEEVRSVLVILNTKTAVRKLFDRLAKDPRTGESGTRLFHLSTNMCAAHRKNVLAEMIAALEAEERVVCVSTQLIEAGVDISFECVIRSLAGLDSIAQAAGRCNRHGKDAIRKVYIVKSADEVLTRLPEMKTGAQITERLLYEFRQSPERFGHELLSAAAMNAYFRYFFHQMKEEMDYPIPQLDHKMFDLLSANKMYYEAYKNKHGRAPEILSRSSFATAERYFEAIGNAAASVLVPYNEDAESLILDLNGELDSRKLGDLLRKAQKYVVNIYDHEMRKLIRNEDVYPLLHGHVLALRKVAYSDLAGVETDGEGEWETAVI
ncbi:CRISPR-associated helicase Cas3' [Paenibacillus cisolokensis]|uniref:CRISPR-associated helicase Cas3' n=1 Tax=Paenibacillus cisolokensis TaxID=1658519 RepID=UPI003D2B9ED6